MCDIQNKTIWSKFVTMKVIQRPVALIFAFLFCAGALRAQLLSSQKPVNLQDYQYHHEASGGLRAQTNGFSLFAEYGWIKDYHRTRLLQIEYSYYIDFQQKKQSAQVQDGRDYIYGLENHFHVIRIAYGFKRTLTDKFDKKGVRLSFVGFGGIALGLLKPYYLSVQTSDTTNPVNIRYRSPADSAFLNRSYILEAAPTRIGLNEIQPVFGLHGKAALDFDWGVKDEFVKALEAGFMIDIYYRNLPIMVNASNHFYQASLFVSFQFGKRW